MLIVLEGERRSGKSTLASILKMALPNAQVIHCTGKTPNDYSFFSDIIKASYNKDIICDRFCYGQFAYQDEDERNLTYDTLHKLEVEMLAGQTSIIYCECSPEEIERRMNLTGKNSANGVYDKTPAQVIKGFEEVLSRSILPIARYNTESKF